ncbi:MAG: sigma-54 dependent transcriptional regulator [Deltaproteobacteria bacterium]|nr:sigma-54 dependent transcriptional regulator [Deltaproteobacteria bacterium]
MRSMNRILVIEDELNLQRSLASFLGEKGYEVRAAATAAEAFEVLAGFEPRAIILDVRLPDASGLDLIEPLKRQVPKARVIMITAFHDMDTTIQAMKRGAFDYLNKPLDIDELERSVQRATHRPKLRSAPARPPAAPAEDAAGRQLVGSSRAMSQIFKTIGLLATNQATVLITGETGTGKEVIARVIHNNSPHSGEPFVTVDCTTLVSNLMESELFGHEKGAFTDASAAKPGRLELAGQGTIFFDEIGDLSPSLQAKLLGFLERREFTRVGGTLLRHSHARIIGATNRSLEKLAALGDFRPDLLFRLKVATVQVPPLRERLEDLEDLVPFFLHRIFQEFGLAITMIEKGVMELLTAYTWPGNVRELLNVLTKAALQCRDEVLLTEAVRAALATSHQALEPATAFPTLAEAEKQHLEAALRLTKWNISAAARLLGVTRPTLRSHLAKHGLRRPA